jgi:hypothetical protein
MINPATGEKAFVPTGFSWTTLLFGAFPALFRLDWKNAAIIAGVLIVSSFMYIAFIPLIVFSFIYNDKMHIRDLLNKGWVVSTYFGSKSMEHVSNSVGYDLSKFDTKSSEQT